MEQSQQRSQLTPWNILELGWSFRVVSLIRPNTPLKMECIHTFSYPSAKETPPVWPPLTLMLMIVVSKAEAKHH